MGVSTSYVYDAARSGRLPSRRLGRRWLIPVDALETWLAELGEEMPGE